MELEGSRWTLSLQNDWRQFLRWRDWNWINVALVQFEPEWDRSLGSVRLTAALLGFRLTAGYVYDAGTPLRDSLRESLDAAWGDAHVSLPVAEFTELKRLAAIARESGA